MRSVAIIGLLFCCLTGLSQNLSNKGKEFWVGYGHHQFMEPGQSNSQEMVLYFSAEQTANVKVTINTTSYVRNYVVPAGAVIASEFIPKAGTFDCRLFSLPPSFGGTGGEGVFDRGIHIESDVPIVAYAHIFGSASSGATMLMPVETYGYSYVSVNSPQVYAANCFSWVYVVAKENNTRIEITPAVPTRNGRAAGVPFQVDLQKGQIYQVIGALIAGSTGHELTGTKVVSTANASGQCYPIAVFAGSSRTAITCPPGGGGSGDNNMQQIFPSQAWGKRYLTAPTSNAGSASSLQTNLFKIAVKDPATVVKRNGVVLTGLINNFYYQYQSNSADYIEADKPIMVAQFMSSSGGCPNTGGDGDPEMMYLSPLEQGIKRIGFYRNTRENINTNYLTLIIPTAGVSSLRIDGGSTFSHTYVHPNLPGYTVVVRRWSPSAQAQCIVQSDSAFTAVTYGLGSVESYGYNAGTLVNNLAAAAFIHNENDPTAPSHQYTCKNTPVEISMLVAYKPNKIVWRLSQLSMISPNTDVTDLSPVIVDSVLVNDLKYYKYRLPGTYMFTQTGTFELPVQNTHPALENCNNTEEVLLPITVKVNPTSNFTYTHSGCISDTVHFSSPANSGNGYTINKWTWTFPDATTSNQQNTSKLFTTPGTKAINLKVVSTEGCVGDTTRDVIVHDKPVTTFGITPAAGCEGDTLRFTDTSSYAGSTPITSWYWDFGNNNTITANNGNPQSMSYAAYGTYTVRHAVKVGNACSSDTVSKVVKINAKPVPAFTYPAGCLPVDGIVQFTSTSTTPDGQALASYAWNFGDPNATAGNPNTSTLPNPTHMYSAYGAYNIIYSVTTVNGCTAIDTVNATFNVRPTLAYPALAAVCENAVALSVASAAVTNGVGGTGTYRGPGTNAAGNFNPAAAGFGTHTIWYVFTSVGGCTDSISQTIRVHAKPVVTFTYPTGGCLPIDGLVQFTNGTTIGDGQSLAYSWNFGDPNATVTNPNTSTAVNPTHNYIDGTYKIKLEATSANGCVAADSVNASFSLRPLLSYPALTPVCQSVTTPVSVATAAVTNGSQGTGIYRGPGTDAAGNFNPSVAGSGTHTIWYVFTTTGGCKDSISQNILVHAKPTVAFTNTTGCLPVTGLVQFTNTSAISDGQPLSCLWDFNDPNANAGNPNTSTLLNPTHNFKEGIYNVKLRVTTANGCADSLTRPITFSLRPQLAYAPLPSVCQSAAGTVSVATATIGNGVTGTGIYRGPGVNAAGNFNPSVAGAGIHTIWYVFTTAGGCKDSVSSAIKVLPKPTASFTATTDVCTGDLATITDRSTISSGRIVSWRWDFGNAASATYNNGNPFTVSYPTHNVYTVKLVAVSDSSCTSDTASQSVNVHALPLANFNLPASICMPDGIAPFNNLTTVPDNASLTYQWNFGDGSAGSSATNPTHTYTRKGPFTVMLTATTAYGCRHDTSKVLDAFFDKPMAAFAVSPDTLCQGTDNVFTDMSGPAGTIGSWAWTFGDNSTSTNPNPGKRYTRPGNYNVQLVVTSTAGCVSDPFSKTVVVYLQPVIDAGPSFVVAQGTILQFKATANDSSTLQFQWEPAADFTNASVLRPRLIAMKDQVYTLTATGQGNCTATDQLTVKIQKPIKVPNAFTPNNDGINDTWVLGNLSDYADATVEIYNRYGQVVHRANAQTRPWDGTYKGSPLPVATYYYIIDLRNNTAPIKGSVTIIR